MKTVHMNTLEPRQRYQHMTPSVGPRPIAFVSSVSKKGVGNLAPFSYFNIGGANPASAMICPLKNRDAETKDTLNNIRETGEYVINIVTREMAENMNQTSWAYPAEKDEFDEVGFERVKSELARAPRVAESPIQMEMKLFKIVEHGDGPLSSSYIIGEIMIMHFDDSVLTDGLPDNEKISHIGRLGKNWYCQVDEESLFEIERPSGP